MFQRAPSVQQFWHHNTQLFADAWAEWEKSQNLESLALNSSLYAPALREAIEAAWAEPSKEGAVDDLWEEVFPGVYKAQCFDPEKLPVLRGFMDKVAVLYSHKFAGAANGLYDGPHRSIPISN